MVVAKLNGGLKIQDRNRLHKAFTSPPLRPKPQSQPILERPPRPLLDTVHKWPVLPLFLRHLDRVAQIFLERTLHIAAEFLAEYDDIDLIVVQEAARIDVGRTDR